MEGRACSLPPESFDVHQKYQGFSTTLMAASGWS